MAIKVIALSDFIHGNVKMDKRGEDTLPDQLAKDLQAANLVVFATDVAVTKAKPVVSNKMAAPARNKVAKTSPLETKTLEIASDSAAPPSADVCTSVAPPAATGSEGAVAADAAPSEPSAPAAAD